MIYNREALVIVCSVALSLSLTNIFHGLKSMRQSQLCCLENLNLSTKEVITYSPHLYRMHRKRSKSYNWSYCLIRFGSNYYSFILRLLIQHIGPDNRVVNQYKYKHYLDINSYKD